MYILPSYTFRLPTYLGTVPSLSVLMIATQKWLCVPLRVRPSVSTCFEKKKGPPVSFQCTYCVGCLVSYSPILHVGLQEEEEEKEEPVRSGVCVGNYLHED